MKTPTNPGIVIQLAVHDAVRRDVTRLSAALADDGAAGEAVRNFWHVLRFQLHQHHEFEDTHVWPLVRERLGTGVDALLDRNLDEHEVMGRAMDGFDALVSAEPLDHAGARLAADAMRTAIDIHLTHEEADVLPLLAQALTVDDIPVLQAQAAEGNPPDALLPWVVDDASDETLAFFGKLPEPVKALLTEVWLPRRMTLVDALGA
jgi:hypothetical protein